MASNAQALAICQAQHDAAEPVLDDDTALDNKRDAIEDRIDAMPFGSVVMLAIMYGAPEDCQALQMMRTRMASAMAEGSAKELCSWEQEEIANRCEAEAS